MKKIIFIMLLMFSINLFATKYAGEIFSIGAGVQNYALGNTGLTNFDSPSLAYWNPALLFNSKKHMELMHSEEFNGMMKLDTFSAIFGRKNPYSIVITKITVTNIPLTKWDNTYNRPYEYKSVSTTDIIAYFGFRTLLKKMNIGFTPKIAYRKLIDISGLGFGADISSFISINENWHLAAKIKDFFTTQIFWSDNVHEIVYPSLNLETNYTFIPKIIDKKFTLYFLSDIMFENRKFSSTFHISSMSFDFHAGLKSRLNKNFLLYLGYDIENITAGLTFKVGKFDINYAFEQSNSLTNSHRISIGYNL